MNIKDTELCSSLRNLSMNTKDAEPCSSLRGVSMNIKDAELCSSLRNPEKIFVIEDLKVRAALEHDRRSIVTYRVFTIWGDYSTKFDCGESTLAKRLFDDVLSQIQLLKERNRLLSIQDFDEIAADALACYSEQ